MADDEQFSLCWNNFNTNLSAGFHESLCRGDLVDVTLAAEGQLVKAHRLVLSVCSPYFRKMFTQMPSNQHAFVFLKDVSHSALKDLIQFMYCGEVNVKHDALPAFISTAEALQIKGLTETAETPANPVASPVKATTPAPSASNTTSPRSRSQRNVSRTSYKLESEDSNDERPPVVQKRAAQRSITPQSTPLVKRIKTVDPLEASEPIQQENVTPDKSGEPEFIDLPIESLPTKAEPDYGDDSAEVEAADQEATYVEDDTYGEMKYDESYFTENDESGQKPSVSGFTESFEGDQSATEAQVQLDSLNRKPRDPRSGSKKPMIEIENVLQGASVPIKLVPTRVGGMKVEYDDNHYSHYFTKSGVTFWRCDNFDITKCPGIVVSKARRVYLFEGQHNHKQKARSDIIKSIENFTFDVDKAPKIVFLNVDEKNVPHVPQETLNVKFDRRSRTPSPSSFRASPAEAKPLLEGKQFKDFLQKRLNLALKKNLN